MQFTYRNPGPLHRSGPHPGRGPGPGRRRLGLPAPDPDRADRTITVVPADPTGSVARYARHDHYARPAVAPSTRSPATWWPSGGGPGWWSTTTPWSTGRPPSGPGSAGSGNTLLLLPGPGSWFVLGSVVTDAPLASPRRGVRPRTAEGCGTCRRCIAACPTGALVDDGCSTPGAAWRGWSRPRARSRSSIRVALGDRIYGCDECQEVCPVNRAGERRHPAPPDRPEPRSHAAVDLLDLLDAVRRRAPGGPRPLVHRRADPRYLRRNALVALGNVGDAGTRRPTAALTPLADGDASCWPSTPGGRRGSGHDDSCDAGAGG